RVLTPHGRAALLFIQRSAATPTYTLSLHDALPISRVRHEVRQRGDHGVADGALGGRGLARGHLLGHERLVEREAEVLEDRALARSEEHTSELQSRENLVCRLLLEKKKNKENTQTSG